MSKYTPGFWGIKRAFIEEDLDSASARSPEATISKWSGSSLDHDAAMRGIVDRADLWERELFSNAQELSPTRLKAAISTVGMDAFIAGVIYGASGGFADVRSLVDLAREVKGRNKDLDKFLENWLSEELLS